MIVDVTTTAHDRDVAIGVLRSRADDVVDVLFADEVGPDENAPIFKPSRVGPHTLVSYDVVGRPALVRTSALRAIGGFDPNVGWAFEHDAYLRLLEAKATFRHVDGVLAAGRPPRAFESESVNGDSRAVVRRAFERRGWRGSIDDTPIPGVIAWSPGVPSPLPSIEIIIPTRDRVDLLRNCISTLEAITTYPNYRIMILDNDSAHDETLQYFAATTHRVVACPGPFNYARIMNRGVAHSSADFVVTLNNDTTAVTPDWLEKMVAIAALDDVGIVGGRLLDEHGRAEHESIVIAPYPQHLRTDANYRHVDQFSHALRDVAVVTGAGDGGLARVLVVGGAGGSGGGAQAGGGSSGIVLVSKGLPGSVTAVLPATAFTTDLPWRLFMGNRCFWALLWAHSVFGIGYSMLIAWLPTYYNQVGMRFGAI